MNAEELTEAIWQRLQQTKPRALLIGNPPNDLQKFNYVNEKPYEAVILGILPPGQLLHMPNNAVCEALLEGIPVWYWERQPFREATRGGALCRMLREAEQRLRQLGVVPFGGSGRLITAAQARELKRMGLSAEGRPMTPLARDILEGKTT